MRIGVDVGGTKIEGLVLHEDGTELVRRRVPTPAGDYEGIVGAIAALVGSLEDDVGYTGPVGLGTPGAVDPVANVIKNSNSTALNGMPLADDVAAVLGRSVRMANDADCFAWSEATDGAGAGADPVFGVILGTGVGGGVVANRRLVSGPNAIAGEWGHNPLPWPQPDETPGPECYCGLRGCVETFLSGPGLERAYLRETGSDMSSRDVVSAAGVGEAAAAKVMDDYIDRLARSLAVVINVIDPEVVVLGGGMSNIDMLYDGVTEIWDRYVFSTSVLTKLHKAKHGDSSGVRGAAWLWPR